MRCSHHRSNRLSRNSSWILRHRKHTVADMPASRQWWCADKHSPVACHGIVINKRLSNGMWPPPKPKDTADRHPSNSCVTWSACAPVTRELVNIVINDGDVACCCGLGRPECFALFDRSVLCCCDVHKNACVRPKPCGPFGQQLRLGDPFAFRATEN